MTHGNLFGWPHSNGPLPVFFIRIACLLFRHLLKSAQNCARQAPRISNFGTRANYSEQFLLSRFFSILGDGLRSRCLPNCCSKPMPVMRSMVTFSAGDVQMPFPPLVSYRSPAVCSFTCCNAAGLHTFCLAHSGTFHEHLNLWATTSEKQQLTG